MMTKKQLIASLAIVAACVFYRCGNSKPEPTDTPTSGEVNIVVDESFQKLFDNQIYTFHSIYQNAKVNARYLPENEALSLLIKDSCKVVVMCRDLTAKERKSFEASNLFPVSTRIAEDAIAIILHPDNKDSSFTVDQIRNILSGRDTLWSGFADKSSNAPIHVVFDNPGSANARFMQDTLLKGAAFTKNAFAVKSNPEVIEYVSKNKNAIGILSVNWISDLDDSVSQNFLKRVKVAAIAQDTASEAFRPYQAYIKTKEYPFTRNVYMINRQTRAGLGMGFVSFVAGDKGQLMILKSGLVPAIAPVRMVQINIE